MAINPRINPKLQQPKLLQAQFKGAGTKIGNIASDRVGLAKSENRPPKKFDSYEQYQEAAQKKEVVVGDQFERDGVLYVVDKVDGSTTATGVTNLTPTDQ